MAVGDIVRSGHRFRGPCSACGDGDTDQKYHTHDPLPPSYTLPELRELARECANEPSITNDDRTLMQLAYNRLLFWLGKREKEANERDT